MRRLIVPIISTIVATVILEILFWKLTLMPALASQQGGATDAIIRVLTTIAVFLFSLVMSFILYSMIAFRARPGDTEDIGGRADNLPLEITWTVIPLLLVIGLGTFGAIELLNVTAPPALAMQQRELRVDVTGRQWSWSFGYPDLGINSTELILPLGQPILFDIRSIDVIHSFWIPEFRFKLDAIPGITNRLRMTPTKTGEYVVHCAELCGTGHALMLAKVRVVEQAEFDSWVQQQQAAASSAAGPDKGRQLADANGCTGCHSTDGSQKVGPTWKGLAGSQVTLADGATVTADDAYIHESIVSPSAKIVKGFPDVMPKDYGQKLKTDEIQALVDYIKSLH